MLIFYLGDRGFSWGLEMLYAGFRNAIITRMFFGTGY